MSSINLPMAVLKSPGVTEALTSDSTLATLKNQTKFQQSLTSNAQQAVNEMHQNRMKTLRKELEYLKDTEWKYEPIEKYIGQNY